MIDEYDVPLDKAFQHGYYKEMVTTIRAVFGKALKTNEALQFAVLTGCLRVSKESIFTGLNNFSELDGACARAMTQIHDRRYSEYLRNEGRNDIWAYGIAFFKKRCKVVAEKLK
mgnify:CR=1 FL=1